MNDDGMMNVNFEFLGFECLALIFWVLVCLHCFLGVLDFLAFLGLRIFSIVLFRVLEPLASFFCVLKSLGLFFGLTNL